MIQRSIQYLVLSYIIIRIYTYILVNSVINHANYLQLKKHYIKYSTSHSYYVVTILHIFIHIYICRYMVKLLI